MANLESILLQRFQSDNRPILIAYSGGVDSQVLLHALANLKQQQLIFNELTVCHVHHGLSVNADAWLTFAEQQCQLRNIPCISVKVQVVQRARHSLEAQARQARYQVLQQHVPAQGLLVTGHHANDQAETLLLALKRGAGLKGLSAMPSELAFGTGYLVRPLLELHQDQIIAYAQQQGLTWIEDESNQDIRYDRNFLRHDILPKLLERWPALLTTMQRSIEHCQQAQALLDEVAQQDFQSCQLGGHSLSVAALSQLSEVRFNQVLRYFFTKQQLQMPSQAQLKQVYQQVFCPLDKTPQIKLGEFWLRRFRDSLVLTPDYVDVSDWYHVVDWHSDTVTELMLPDGLGHLTISTEPSRKKTELGQHIQVQIPHTNTQVVIRFSHHNPICHPDFRDKSRALKKIWQELNIAPWQRPRVPLLYFDQQLVAALGYFVCRDYVAQRGQQSLTLNWLA
jgi:tRNA(Ile)-lysidine synthase